ncbi:MAG: hypothetical protein ACI9LM_005205 [Alteromonadaceae bacterium]|jgi:hypothetical protein
MIDTEKARNELKKAFPFTEVCTKYIAKYNTKSGKEIAIERDRSEAFYVWLQKFDTTAGIEGIKIKNEKFPGQPYDRKQTRNSNLNENNSPKLKLGQKVWYLEIENIEALKKLISWYAEI